MAGLTLGIIFPAFIYALVITRGSLNLFGWEYGWAAYNQYALALVDGRFDVPLEAIGAEGFIINGRVYMYYGLLPAIARWPLISFLDLDQTPVSLLMTWLFCTIAAAMIQLALLRIYWSAQGHSTADRLLLLAASIVVWFGSGPWLALQNGSFYHEPFAIGLMLSGIVLYMLVDDVLLRTRSPSVARLCAYALLAGLTVFARQTMAISLYAVTLAMIAAPLLRERWSGSSLARTTGRAIVPLSILFLFGAVHLWTVAVRFGGDSFPMQSYGYYIVYASSPDYPGELSRLVSTESVGQFHPTRFLPNLMFYMVGGYHIRDWLITAMGGGDTEAFGPAVKLALVWAGSLLFAAAGAWAMAMRHRSLQLALLLAALCLGAILQLCYATAAYRYATEFWPPIAFLLLIAWTDRARHAPSTTAPARFPAAVLLAITLTMLAYNLYRSSYVRNDVPTGVGAVTKPMPAVLVALVDRESP